MDEFQKLLTTPITEKYLERYLDMFLFACFSVMSYANVCNLSERHITQDDHDIMWIKIERLKIKSECRIRLLSVPIQITDKYKHERKDDKIFKLKTLKTIDKNLKTIAQNAVLKADFAIIWNETRMPPKYKYYSAFRLKHSAKL